MNVDRVHVERALRLLARAHQVLGWAGWAGIAACAVAGSMLLAQRPDESAALPAADLHEVPVATQVAEPPPAIVARADIPLVITQLEHAALDNGLGWPAADYHVAPATDRLPARLEVRLAFKAPYPKLRAMLAQVLKSVPGVTLRELRFTRPNAQSADVDAHVVVGIFVEDDAAAPAPAAASDAEAAR